MKIISGYIKWRVGLKCRDMRNHTTEGDFNLLYKFHIMGLASWGNILRMLPACSGLEVTSHCNCVNFFFFIYFQETIRISFPCSVFLTPYVQADYSESKHNWSMRLDTMYWARHLRVLDKRNHTSIRWAQIPAATGNVGTHGKVTVPWELW